jgi:RNA polymerase sigma-70 factor (ECF subfamily)
MGNGLIRQILEGNSALFEQIVLEYQNLVFTVCLNIVQNEHDAENMAQETFLSAYCSLRDFHGGNIKSWLCRIAVNKSIDFKRKQSKMSFEDFAETLAHAGSGVEEQFMQTERKERLRKILSLIPRKYSSVIQAFYFNGLQVKEIAGQMQLPEKTVETRLYRARKIIKERWGEDGF